MKLLKTTVSPESIFNTGGTVLSNIPLWMLAGVAVNLWTLPVSIDVQAPRVTLIKKSTNTCTSDFFISSPLFR